MAEERFVTILYNLVTEAKVTLARCVLNVFGHVHAYTIFAHGKTFMSFTYAWQIHSHSLFMLHHIVGGPQVERVLIFP